MRALVIAAALTAISACGQTTVEKAERTEAPGPTAPADRAPSPTIPTDPAAGPSGADNMTWHFTHYEGQAPALRYGSYGSEDQAIALRCEGARIAAILWRGQQRETWPFTLQSGGAHANLNGVGEGDSEVAVTAHVPRSSPVMAAFRQTGDLTLSEDGQSWVMDAINDQERQAIAQFFAACSQDGRLP